MKSSIFKMQQKIFDSYNLPKNKNRFRTGKFLNVRKRRSITLSSIQVWDRGKGIFQVNLQMGCSFLKP